jgi:hypothetical protein
MQPRFLLGADFMGNDRRLQILKIIGDTRGDEQSIIKRLEGMPNWLQKPFGADQGKFDAALSQFKANDAAVAAIESRLTTQPGPNWKELSPEETAALQDWVDAADQLDGLTSKYYPLESEKDWKKLLLLGIGVTAIFAPLFFTEGEDGFRMPRVKPPALPESVTPSARRTLPPAGGPAPSPFMPRPDVIRPVATTFRVPSPAPFRPAGAPPSFMRPSAPPPGAPASPVTSSSPRSPLAPPGTSPVHGASRFTYPRFRNA